MSEDQLPYAPVRRPLDRRLDRTAKYIGNRGDLRWQINALAPGETLEVSVEGTMWEALNSARKRASRDTGLKYRIRQDRDRWVVLAYDPRDKKPSLAKLVKVDQPSQDDMRAMIEEIARPIIRQIVREEFAHLF